MMVLRWGMKMRNLMLKYTLLILPVFIIFLGFRYYYEIFIPIVPLDELRLEIVTDRSEYVLGEVVNVTFYLVNDRPYPVRIVQPNEYWFAGYSEGDQNKTLVGVFVTPSEEKFITIPPYTRYKLEQFSFKPALEGSFKIYIVIENLKVSKIVKIK
ncbi:MAG: hypothetical protein NDF54_04020 [archaeon GB-1867-035]|nr:hypothetical protein [Candidatus Culexmicrobium profundum]